MGLELIHLLSPLVQDGLAVLDRRPFVGDGLAHQFHDGGLRLRVVRVVRAVQEFTRLYLDHRITERTDADLSYGRSVLEVQARNLTLRSLDKEHHQTFRIYAKILMTCSEYVRLHHVPCCGGK